MILSRCPKISPFDARPFSFYFHPVNFKILATVIVVTSASARNIFTSHVKNDIQQLDVFPSEFGPGGWTAGNGGLQFSFTSWGDSSIEHT